MESTIIIPEIERVATDAKIEHDGIIALQNKFSPHFQAFAALAEDAKAVRDDEPKKARTMRLKVRAIRLAADETRKEMKADSLRRGKAIDGVNNILLLAMAPVEEKLEQIEKAEEIREANRKTQLKLEREAQLAKYTDNPFMIGLEHMPDAQFADLLAGAKSVHDSKIAAQEAAAKAEHERKLAEEAERMRIVQENARLAKLAADEKAAREEAERKAADERAESARLAKIEADKRDAAERAQREKERQEREREAAKAAAALAKERAERAEAEMVAKETLAKETAARAKIQAEIAAKEKAEAERIAKEQAAAKKAAAAPDQEKVRRFADVVGNLDIPELADKAIQNKIREQIMAMNRWLVTLSTKIGE